MSYNLLKTLEHLSCLERVAYLITIVLLGKRADKISAVTKYVISL